MKIELRRAELAEKGAIANLLQLYLHDFSDMDHADVGNDGRFAYP